MPGRKSVALLSTLLAAALLPLAHGAPAAPDTPALSPAEKAALHDFAAIHPIDDHVHIFQTSPLLQQMLDQDHLTLLNILVVDDTWGPRKQLQPQIDFSWRLVHSSHGHIKLCTTFDPYRFNDPDFTAASIRQINRDFRDGAIAVKIWKNFGMEIRDSHGNYVLPDNPKLEPIYADIAQHGKTLMAHLAEPDLAWEPLDVKKDPLAEYYIENPQWHMLDKPGAPSKQTILQARDHILARNPNLRVIGLHLGSMEKDLDGLALDLDRYPNFAVDTAARMEYLEFGNRDKVRAFLLRYQDRVIYGTDLDINPGVDVRESVQEWQQTYASDWRFLATDQTFQVYGRTVHGLDLPPSVLRKIYRTNAQHWIKGL